VFLIGSPRSGTSILAWSLAQHSRLWTSNETHILYELFGRGYLDGAGRGPQLVEKAFGKAKDRPEGTWLEKQSVSKKEFLGFLGVGLNALFTSRSGDRRWVDQTPSYTTMVDLLADMFPGAQFVHILRDGRRVVHSMVHFLKPNEELKRSSKAGGHLPPWAEDFQDACRTWRNFVEASLRFAEHYPGRAVTVTNEDLVRNPDREFRRLFEFLGVPPEEGPAAFFASNRINSSFRPNSKDRAWVQQLTEPWKEWTEEQCRVFAEEAGETLVRCGFAAAEGRRTLAGSRTPRAGGEGL
jgi:hypothetical protein